MANEDEDKLAGAEGGAGGNPAKAEGAVSTGEGPVPGAGDEAAHGAAGSQHAPDGDGHSGFAADDGAAAGSEGNAADRLTADEAARAGDGPDAGELDPRLSPGPANRPAGFAAGYLRRDPAAHAGGGESAEGGGSVWMPHEAGQPGGQESPYTPYGEYDPYPAPGQEQDYGGYGYGADQGYGQGQGYAPEAYGQAYPPPDYGDAGGYSSPESYAGDQPYGDDPGYGQGTVYGQEQQPYGEGQAYGQPGYAQAPYGGQPYSGGTSYGQGPAYDQGQSYDQGQAYDQGQSYGQGQAYGQGPGYGQAPGAGGGQGQTGQTKGDDQPPADSQDPPDGQDGGAAQSQAGSPGAHAAAGAPGAPAGRTQAPAPGREPGAGSAAPYPPQDSYRWPPPYGASGAPAPPQAGRSPYDPQGRYAALGQLGGSGGAHSAARPYGREPAYPAPGAAPAGAAPAGGANPLPPLPGQAVDQPQVPETANDLTAEALLHGKRQAPGGGWRRVLYKGSGGLIHPRESAEAVRRRELVARVRTPVAGGHHRVAVMSLKGGVGKTTTCVSLGAMLASLRGDRIIALDANPDRGTLSDKVRLETAATVRDLLNEREQIQRYADVRAFTSQAPSRLEVLASDRDPAVSIAFSEDDYYDAARVLEHYYSISLTDCGTGLLHSAMAGVLRMADQIVLVSSPSVDGARSASATLDWLDAHEYGDLVRNAVVVLSMIRPRSKSSVDLDRLEHHFASRCRAVARIPYDAHLEEGAEVDLEQMSAPTVNAYLVLAATVGDGFAWPRRAVRQTALAE